MNQCFVIVTRVKLPLSDSLLVQVWQISARSASGPASEIGAGESKRRPGFAAKRRVAADSACAAEQFGKLRDPGFQLRSLRRQLFGFLLVTDAPQGGQEISK
jgi:hypothetical protein